MMRKRRNRRERLLSSCKLTPATSLLTCRASIFTKDFKAVASSVSGWKEGEAYVISLVGSDNQGTICCIGDCFREDRKDHKTTRDPRDPHSVPASRC